MLLKNLIDYLNKAANIADANVENSIDKYVDSFIQHLKRVAPVDSGKFKESWTSSKAFGSVNKQVIISNSQPYASAIEFGSVPGNRPWPSPGPKTELESGRIYSSQAVGGTIEKIFNDSDVLKFCNGLATSILRAFK